MTSGYHHGGLITSWRERAYPICRLWAIAANSVPNSAQAWLTAAWTFAQSDKESSLDAWRKLRYSTTCLKRPLKNKTKILMTNGSLMQVKSIAESSKRSILQYFWPALSDKLSWKPNFGLFESGHFIQVLLYFATHLVFNKEWRFYTTKHAHTENNLMYIYGLYRGSYMSVHVLLNLLNKLGKRDKMRGLPSILSLFRNKFNKFNNTRARMLDSIYHMTLRVLWNLISAVKML